MEKNHRKNDMRYVEYLGTISENIKLFRAGLGITQKELASKAGVGLSTAASAEKGEEISLKNLIKLAEALEIELADLFISEKDRERVNYKLKLFVDKLAETFDLEGEKAEKKK